MGLNKATGDMYDWVTHTHTHLRGACPHACPYCYARKGRAQRFYQGELRLEAKELHVGYGSIDHKPKTIFIEHMMDLFAEGVQNLWISKILEHCCQTPENTYVFQTRNLERLGGYVLASRMPMHAVFGTTVESDIGIPEFCGIAPSIYHRMDSIRLISEEGLKTYITIEPIMNFSPQFGKMIIEAHPAFVNIGADSKACGLPEPSAIRIIDLIEELCAAHIDVRLKPNLKRLLKDAPQGMKFEFTNGSVIKVEKPNPESVKGWHS